MLLALRIKNFQSIRDAHVRFGPLTCLVGHNGVGKSNLFNAIRFISALANTPIDEAAQQVKAASGLGQSPTDLIHNHNKDHKIELHADMIVPKSVVDDFGEPATPTTTLLTYEVHLQFSEEYNRLMVVYESLVHAKWGDYKSFVGFKTSNEFRESIKSGTRRSGAFIDTHHGKITLHGDAGSKSRSAPVGRSPLTVVGGTRTGDYPTVLAAKREMSSWRVLHLEPSAMRSPDFRHTTPMTISGTGARIPSTLDRLMRMDASIRSELILELNRLHPEVEDVEVRHDKARDQLELRARVSGTSDWLYAPSLSDGTLRFIALVTLLLDVDDRAVLCIEEPENGMHPSRIPILVELLRDYAVSQDEVVDEHNPLRQVVVSTHSPEIVRQMTTDEILFVQLSSGPAAQRSTVFRPVSGSWYTQLRDAASYPMPIGSQAIANYIGGSPINTDFEQQSLEFEFGTAQ